MHWKTSKRMGEDMTRPKNPTELTESIEDLVSIGKQVHQRLRSRTRWFAALLVVLVGFGITALSYQSQETHRLHRVIDKDCGTFEALATIPIPRNASPVLLRIVNANRLAYENRCTGVLGPLPPVQFIPPTGAPTPTPG